MMSIFPAPERDRWDFAKIIFFIGMVPGGGCAFFWAMSAASWGGVPVRLVIALLITLAGGLSALLYMAPTVTAGYRDHHNTKAIGALNFLLGWTFLGWIGAFVWAMTSSPQRQDS